MITINATIKGGRLELDVPPDWRDGTEVLILPLEHGTQADADTMSAEEIARTLSAMDQVKPLEVWDSERATWEAEREARNRREKAIFMEHAESLRRVWE